MQVTVRLVLTLIGRKKKAKNPQRFEVTQAVSSLKAAGRTAL